MPFPMPIQILAGPGDLADWSETAFITRVEFQRGNFLVSHTKEGRRSDSWPPQHVPSWGDIDRGGKDPGDIQWTLYVVVHNGVQWVTGPCILFWPEHYGGVGGPFSDGANNWWYQNQGMNGNQPGPGKTVGVIAVAGALRGLNIHAISERSNVCWLTVPPNDTGVFDFATPVPVPVPEPIPEPVPVPVPEPPPVPPVPVPVPPVPIPPISINIAVQAILAAFKGIQTQLVLINQKLDKK